MTPDLTVAQWEVLDLVEAGGAEGCRVSNRTARPLDHDQSDTVNAAVVYRLANHDPPLLRHQTLPQPRAWLTPAGRDALRMQKADP